jgi:hypothetical protein
MAKECRNAANIPIYFYTEPDLPAPCSYKFSPGLGQKFPSHMWSLDTSVFGDESKDKYNIGYDNLFSSTNDLFYPIVLSIETVYPSTYTGKGRKNI